MLAIPSPPPRLLGDDMKRERAPPVLPLLLSPLPSISTVRRPLLRRGDLLRNERGRQSLGALLQGGEDMGWNFVEEVACTNRKKARYFVSLHSIFFVLSLSLFSFCFVPLLFDRGFGLAFTRALSLSLSSLSGAAVARE